MAEEAGTGTLYLLGHERPSSRINLSSVAAATDPEQRADMTTVFRLQLHQQL
jgi:hypothetical protein